MNVADITVRQLVAMHEEIRGKRPLASGTGGGSSLADVVRKYRPKTLKVITFDLSTQITDTNISQGLRKVPGSFVFYIFSTNPTDRINLRLGSGADNDIIPFQPGNLLCGFPFDALQIGVPTAITSATASLLVAEVSPDEVVLAL